MGREFELKFSATASVQAMLQETYGPWTAISMETTYFDTPDHTLSARHVTLRLRKENEITVCTLKTPLADGSRGEWECAAANIQDGIPALIALGAPKELEQWTQNGVIPCCGARFTRFAALIPTTDGTAELALDSGFLQGGNREMPLCEVELELKSGSEAAVVTLARQIAHRYQLTEESKSKFRRAMDLAQGV